MYKLDVIHYINEKGTSLRETADFFNIPSCETLRKWKVAYETEGFDALKLKKKGPQIYLLMIKTIIIIWILVASYLLLRKDVTFP